MSETTNQPHELTQKQLDDLGYTTKQIRHKRPVLICDVDEVVLHLVEPFVKVLEERGFALKNPYFQIGWQCL